MKRSTNKVWAMVGAVILAGSMGVVGCSGSSDTGGEGGSGSGAGQGPSGVGPSTTTTTGTSTSTRSGPTTGTSTSTLSGVGPSSTGSGTQTCDSGNTDSCSVCVDNQCCAQSIQCENDPDCVDLYNCVVDCSDDACVQDCANQYPGGIDDFNAFADCANGLCGNACGSSSGSSSSSSSTGGSTTGTSTSSGGGQCNSGTDACGVCLDQSCCSESIACSNNADCNSLFECLSNCGSDDTCQNDCINTYPNGANDLSNLLNCIDDNCSSSC